MRRMRVVVAVALFLLTMGCGRTGDTDKATAFVRDLGWTPEGQPQVFRVEIPDSFVDGSGAFPLGLYWAFNAELSRGIGFDIAPYRGRTVTVVLVPVREGPPEDPGWGVRAVVIVSDGRVVGGWLDRVGHYGFSSALNRKSFGEITGLTWGEWLKRAGMVDYGTGIEKELASLAPAEVIRIYFAALDSGDYARARACLSRANLSGVLFANRVDPLFNTSFAQSAPGGSGLENVRAARVLSIMEREEPPREEGVRDRVLHREVYQRKQFYVETEMTYKVEMVRSSGRNPWFIGMVRETPDAPWLIDGCGTGP